MNKKMPFSSKNELIEGAKKIGQIKFNFDVSEILKKSKLLTEIFKQKKINEWIQFFLSGVSEIAEEAIETVYKITKLREQDILQIQGMDKRSSKSAIEVLPKLFALPIVDTSIIQKWTGFTRNGSQKLIDRFVDLGILSLRDVNKKYNKSYIYKNYVDIFYKIHTGE